MVIIFGFCSLDVNPRFLSGRPEYICCRLGFPLFWPTWLDRSRGGAAQQYDVQVD